MTRRIEPVCANCKHLIKRFVQIGGDTWHYCPIMKAHIRIRESWTETCENWKMENERIMKLSGFDEE